MFETTYWSDVDENEISSISNLGSSEIPVRNIGEKKIKKRNRTKKIKTSSTSLLPNVNENIKKAASRLGISKQIDACLNSPSLTTSLIGKGDGLEEDQPTMKKRKRAKKRKIFSKASISSENLLDTSVENTGKVTPKSLTCNGSTEAAIGSILKKGTKFSSESDFVNFMTPETTKCKKSSKSRKLKNKGSEAINGDQQSPTVLPEVTPPKRKKKAPLPPDVHGNIEPKDSVLSKSNPFHPDNMSNSDLGSLSDTNPFHQNYGESNSSGAGKFDIDKLKVLFNTNGSGKYSKQSMDEEKLCDYDKSKEHGESEAKRKLKSSRFRFLNEKLYTQTGSESLKMFKGDDGVCTFKAYHEGFAEQVKRWPIDPLDLIISSIMKKKCDTLVIADFGCGEARLARSLSSTCEKIYSFDLVALNENVTVCDFRRTPLENESIDIIVFCLSLMGTNLRDYMKEANRVLKIGGVLKVAEVESRFEGEHGIENFIQFAEKSGFSLKWKDLKKDYFNLFDFKKTSKFHNKKAPDVILKPCLYKKR